MSFSLHRFADQLQHTLANQSIVQLTARTQVAKRWLAAHSEALIGRTIRQITTHGKNLIGWIEGDYYFYSHLMMWGRWMTFEGDAPEIIDRREHARIVTPTAGAILLSAPVFQLGQGDPYAQVEVLRSLGPDILPKPDEAFDQAQFRD
ncbi:DNA-formamidopyrimidine glycosylase family protein [Leptolyngbya sp. AN03gr2]|uniref:DNA-formamidopyrimidine glycosylase family protein n=1 Tax=unclassified Leptolyngbya TaxID=2650499 RepID=UPI003D315863